MMDNIYVGEKKGGVIEGCCLLKYSNYIVIVIILKSIFCYRQ